MNPIPKIGIAVTANNIETSTVIRFLKLAMKSIAPNDEIEISTTPTLGPYNKSRHLNDCLRILIAKKCDIIVQTDIDVEFTRELIEDTRTKTVDGFYLWTPFYKKGVIRWSASGSWNALRVTDWIKIGGYDERFFEWGGEDEDLHQRCRVAGFQEILGKPHPYHHEHPLRSSWSVTTSTKGETRTRNVQITQEKNFVNYLTDSLSPSRGITLHLTSRCLRKCPECCLQDFLSHDPDYYISEQEINNFVQALERSPVTADRVILCGGEPLLCPTLPYVIRKLNECSKVKYLTLYTGLVEGFDLTSLPAMKRGSIRISRYGGNDVLIQDALQKSTKLNVADRRYHIRMANQLYPEIIPGVCYNPEVFIYKERAYTCPMVAQNLIRYQLAPIDSSLYSEPLTNRFFDRTRGWKTGAMLTCSGCAGNTYLKRVTGAYCNEK